MWSNRRMSDNVSETGPVLAKTSELAREYGVSKATFLEWHRAGVIPVAVAVGKVFRWDREAVAQALRDHGSRQLEAEGGRVFCAPGVGAPVQAERGLANGEGGAL